MYLQITFTPLLSSFCTLDWVRKGMKTDVLYLNLWLINNIVLINESMEELKTKIQQLKVCWVSSD